MRYLLAAALLVIGVNLYAADGEVFTLKMYSYHIGGKFTFGWDPSEGAEWYDVEGYHYEQDTPISKSTWEKITNTQLEIVYPRYGHIAWRVRACRKDPDGGDTPDCSKWAETDKGEFTNDNPWWTYGYLAAPGNGGIN